MSKSTNTSFWSYVNSPVAIWFLSTIVISVVSFSYNYYSSKSTSYFTNQEKIRKLDLEISSRLKHLARKSSLFKSNQQQFIKVLLLVNKVELSEFPIGVAEEYEKRHISSLILELISIVKIQKENDSFILPQPIISYDDQLTKLEKAFSASEKFIILFDDIKLQSLKKQKQLDKSTKNSKKKKSTGGKWWSIVSIVLNDMVSEIVKSLKWEKHFSDLNLVRWGSPFEDTFGNNITSADETNSNLDSVMEGKQNKNIPKTNKSKSNDDFWGDEPNEKLNPLTKKNEAREKN